MKRPSPINLARLYLTTAPRCAGVSCLPAASAPGPTSRLSTCAHRPSGYSGAGAQAGAGGACAAASRAPLRQAARLGMLLEHRVDARADVAGSTQPVAHQAGSHCGAVDKPGEECARGCMVWQLGDILRPGRFALAGAASRGTRGRWHAHTRACSATKPSWNKLYRASRASFGGSTARSAICFCSSCFLSVSSLKMRRPAHARPGLARARHRQGGALPGARARPRAPTRPCRSSTVFSMSWFCMTPTACAMPTQNLVGAAPVSSRRISAGSASASDLPCITQIMRSPIAACRHEAAGVAAAPESRMHALAVPCRQAVAAAGRGSDLGRRHRRRLALRGVIRTPVPRAQGGSNQLRGVLAVSIPHEVNALAAPARAAPAGRRGVPRAPQHARGRW